MGIFTRFNDIVNSNINAILDKAEDPEKIVRLMIQEMEDTLVEVRSAAARSIADKKDLNRKIESLDREKDDWDGKAELAMRKGREDLAKAALVEKSRVASAVELLKEDYVAVDDGLAKLNEDIARLESKLEDAKARQKTLLARHKTASSRLAARKKIHDYKIDDAMVRFEAYTRRIDDVDRGPAIRRPETETEQPAEVDVRIAVVRAVRRDGDGEGAPLVEFDLCSSRHSQ